MPFPGLKARAQLIADGVAGEASRCSSADYLSFARRLKNFSAADVNTVVREALMEPVRYAVKSSHFKSKPFKRTANRTVCP